ncbi:hypothetical protein HMPREF1987_00247 [Peptostreptococcaceae bacterium oral taxon 113 str. W5053]|nr:hypothetical protein HMPREF1987_00247 [Peptostreptococcaceae bacterium oral taxon 113 str. W5053]
MTEKRRRMKLYQNISQSVTYVLTTKRKFYENRKNKLAKG